MPLPLKKIESLRQLQQIDDIASLPITESLPVIIKILADIQLQIEKQIAEKFAITISKKFKQAVELYLRKRIEDETVNLQDLLVSFTEQDALFLKLLHTEIFLTLAIALYLDADDKQNASLFALGWKMRGLNNKKIRLPFILLNDFAKEIFIPQETQSLWQELILWLQGYYQHTYRKISPDTKVLPNDARDQAFKKFFGLTQYDMACYYNEVANRLILRLNGTRTI